MLLSYVGNSCVHRIATKCKQFNKKQNDLLGTNKNEPIAVVNLANLGDIGLVDSHTTCYFMPQKMEQNWSHWVGCTCRANLLPQIQRIRAYGATIMKDKRLVICQKLQASDFCLSCSRYSGAMLIKRLSQSGCLNGREIANLKSLPRISRFNSIS